MWPTDYHVTAKQLRDFRARLLNLASEVEQLSDDVAEAEMQAPFTYPGPMCGFLAQSRICLSLAAAALAESLVERDAEYRGDVESSADEQDAAEFRGGVSIEAPPPLAEPILAAADGEQNVTLMAR